MKSDVHWSFMSTLIWDFFNLIHWRVCQSSLMCFVISQERHKYVWQLLKITVFVGCSNMLLVALYVIRDIYETAQLKYVVPLNNHFPKTVAIATLTLLSVLANELQHHLIYWADIKSFHQEIIFIISVMKCMNNLLGLHELPHNECLGADFIPLQL